MGSCAGKQEDVHKLPPLKVKYVRHYPIGRGSFGKVWKVSNPQTGCLYALKESLKTSLISKKSVNLLLNERKLLAVLRHPFLVCMREAYQDHSYLYIAMEFMAGGDLRFHLSRRKVFSEAETKFLVACVVAAVEYLHVNNVVHRDIKPENLVFDSNGYLKLTDFGISRYIGTGGLIYDSSGTPGYMSPESIYRLPHGKAHDFFAVGVIAFECMTGRRPYSGKSRSEIKDLMIAQQVQLKKKDIPSGWSSEAVDFINKLIQRKPEFRLGYKGLSEVKNHSWLRGFPWAKLLEKSLEAPFVPPKCDNFDARVIARMPEEVPKPPTDTQNQLFAGWPFDEGQRGEGEAVDTEPNGK